MVPFAGYEMPVQYAGGVMAEHLHCRAGAGLFDVSHMGQVILRPKSGMEALCLAFESLMPVDVLGLAEGRQRYGLLTNETGGILDDLMFANRGDHLFVVVNAGCKEADVAHLRAHLSGVAEVDYLSDRALLALQGPLAEAALAQVIPQVAAMRFMDVGVFGDIWVSRSGYTGEDGFEVSLPQDQAHGFAETLLQIPQVMPIGLGARDSLRLEAGLCLYGHDITEKTSPIEAGLAGRSINPAGRAAVGRADFRGQSGFCTRSPMAPNACASACAPRAALRCAKAPLFLPPMARPWARSPRAVLALVRRPRSPWAMSPHITRRPARFLKARCAASVCPSPSPRFRYIQPLINAEEPYDEIYQRP